MKRSHNRTSAEHEKQGGNLQPRLQQFYLCITYVQTLFENAGLQDAGNGQQQLSL